MMGVLASGPNALFLAGDLGQRIFQLPFSWAALGVDVRGRSSCLRINCRTSRQIREAVDRLLAPKVRDVEGVDDEALPPQSRVDEATDGDELDTIFETERHLFHVACTRARDHLHVSGVKPISDFVADMAIAE